MSGIFQRLDMLNYENGEREVNDRAPFLDAVAENTEDLETAGDDVSSINEAGAVADEVLATRNIALRQSESEAGISPDAAEAISVQTESWNRRLGSKIFGTVRQESFRSKASAKTQTMVMESGFMNKLKTIWEAIVAMLKKAKDWFLSIWNNLFGSSATGGCAAAAEDLKASVKLWDEIKIGDTHRLKDNTPYLTFNRTAEAFVLAGSGTTPGILPSKVSNVKANAADIAKFYEGKLTPLMKKLPTEYQGMAKDVKSLQSKLSTAGGKSGDKQEDGAFSAAYDSVAPGLITKTKALNAELNNGFDGESIGMGKTVKVETVNSENQAGGGGDVLELKTIRVIHPTGTGASSGKDLEVITSTDIAIIIEVANDFVKLSTDISKTKADGDKAAAAISDCAEAADSLTKAFEKAGNAKLTDDESKKVSKLAHVMKEVAPIMKACFLETSNTLVAICKSLSSDLKEASNKVMEKTEAE